MYTLGRLCLPAPLVLPHLKFYFKKCYNEWMVRRMTAASQKQLQLTLNFHSEIGHFATGTLRDAHFATFFLRPLRDAQFATLVQIPYEIST
jgi:hypothetical protein